MKNFNLKELWSKLSSLLAVLCMCYWVGSWAVWEIYGNKFEHFAWRDRLLFALGREHANQREAVCEHFRDQQQRESYSTYTYLFGKCDSVEVTRFYGTKAIKYLECKIRRKGIEFEEVFLLSEHGIFRFESRAKVSQSAKKEVKL